MGHPARRRRPSAGLGARRSSTRCRPDRRLRAGPGHAARRPLRLSRQSGPRALPAESHRGPGAGLQ